MKSRQARVVRSGVVAAIVLLNVVLFANIWPVNQTGNGITSTAPPRAANAQIGEGLDNATLTFTTGGDADWTLDTTTSQCGGDSIKSGPIDHNQESWVTVTLYGCGNLSFWWRVSSERNWDYLRWYVNGTQQAQISDDGQWEEQSQVIVGTGPHTIKWAYEKDGSVDRYQDCGWVDCFSWENFSCGCANLADGVDNFDFTFVTGGDANWFCTQAEWHHQLDSLQSGIISDNQESWINTTTPGVGNLTFWWKVSSEASCDKLRVLVDGVEEDVIDGEVDWTFVRIQIPTTGIHQVRWVYTKDVCGTSGQDCGWIDQVAYEQVPVAAAFQTNASSILAGQSIQFSDASTGGTPPYTCTWDFGDGTSGAAGTTVVHPFAAPGIYSVTITVTDDVGAQDTAVAKVTVQSASTPSITHPADLSYVAGTRGHVLSWTIVDAAASNPVYSISVDGTVLATGPWTSGVPLSANVDGLTVGLHTVTFSVSDGDGGYALDTVTVTVTNPSGAPPANPTQVHPTLTHPPDVTYVFNTTGHNVTWVTTDGQVTLTSYAVYFNGTAPQNVTWVALGTGGFNATPLATGTWVSGANITVGIDGFPAGTYNLTIVVVDGTGGVAIDVVRLVVTATSDGGSDIPGVPLPWLLAWLGGVVAVLGIRGRPLVRRHRASRRARHDS